MLHVWSIQSLDLCIRVIVLQYLSELPAFSGTSDGSALTHADTVPITATFKGDFPDISTRVTVYFDTEARGWEDKFGIGGSSHSPAYPILEEIVTALVGSYHHPADPASRGTLLHGYVDYCTNPQITTTISGKVLLYTPPQLFFGK